jgi:hypothetical protein
VCLATVGPSRRGEIISERNFKMDVTAVKNGEFTVRTADGRFGHGNPGRKPGSRNKGNSLIDAINDCDPEALQSIVKQTVDAAKAGKVWAIQIIFDKLFPALKERAVSFELRHIATVADVAAALYPFPCRG